MIVASAPEADAPPDALADGAVTATADSAPDALALTDPLSAETGTKIRESGRLKICHGLADNDFADSGLCKSNSTNKCILTGDTYPPAESSFANSLYSPPVIVEILLTMV